MSLSSLLRRCAMFAVALAALAAVPSQATTPPAPAGWTAAAQGDAEIYSLDRDGHHAELRLFAIEAAPSSFDDWFAARIARPMQGVLAQKFNANSPPPSPTFHVAMTGGRDGNGARLGLVRVGCQRADRRVVFAEMVFPDDQATGRSAGDSAFALVKNVCHEGASETAAPASAAVAKRPPRRDYAFRAATPGSGIRPSQIETVLMRWTNRQSGMTMQVHTYFYLLLKDGTFRDGLPPAAPEDIDLAAAQKGEPNVWGRWTRSGVGYHLVWPDKTERDLGAGAVREPARAGEMLDGLYKGFSAYSTGYSVASSEWSVQFSRDGHFLKSANRSVVGSVGGAAGGGGVNVGGAVISDDHGTTSTMGGGNFATARDRPVEHPAASRAGTYKVSGWSIELDYDNGVVERGPFCTTGDRKAIWFEGGELNQPPR